MFRSRNDVPGARWNGIGTLVAMTLGQIVFSGLATYWISTANHLGRRIVVLHVAIVASLFVTIVLMLGWSLRFRLVCESPVVRRLLLLLPGFASMALAFLYLGDYISGFWGRNLNYLLVLQHARALARGRGIVTVGALGWGVLACYLAGFVLMYQVVCERYWTGIRQLLPPRASNSPVRHEGMRAGTALVGFSWLAIVTYLAMVWNTPTGFLVPQFEPVTSFFVPVFPTHPPSAPSAAPAPPSEDLTQYTAGADFDRRNVVLITIDSARADHLQPYGYLRPTAPFLTGLINEGVLRKVEMVLSTCSETVCGIESTLASQPYSRLSNDNLKLQEVLRALGYRSYFILSGIHDWYGLKQFYGTPHDLLFDGTQTQQYTAGDDRLLFEGLERVPVYDGRPAFFSFHLMSAHDVGFRQEEFRIYQPASREWFRPLLRWQNRDSYVNGYDNGLTQADGVIRGLFQALRTKGYLENSLVVIQGDHGEALGERGPTHHIGHITELYQEFVRIPLFIYDDPNIHYRNLAFATQIDIAPTVLDRLGLPIPASWSGRSLLAPEPESRYTLHHSTAPDSKAVRMVVHRTRDRTFKYMRTPRGEELYEVVSDPREEKNLMTTISPEVLAEMRKRLEVDAAE